MALPDRFEQVGILIGSMFLVGLPVSALVSVVYGFGIRPWAAALVWFLPGLVVGIPLARGSLPCRCLYEGVNDHMHRAHLDTLTRWNGFDRYPCCAGTLRRRRTK